MSERDWLLREIQVREELLGLYARLRDLDSGAPRAPAAVPPPAAPPAAPQSRPRGEPVAKIPYQVVQGPGGAVAPIVDLSSVQHLIQGGPEARRALELNIADMVAALHHGHPVQDGALRYSSSGRPEPSAQPVVPDPGGVGVR